MALEDLTGTKYIDSLNSANPVAADDFVDGTSHLQGIKNVLKTTFPNLDGAVTATPADLNATSSLATDYAPITRGARKNRIINGCFRVWQRTITHIGPTNADYTADRWQYVYTGTGVSNVARSVATSSQTYDSLIWHCTTTDTSVASTDTCALKYNIEGIDIQDFNLGNAAAKTVTLSFQHKHTLTGTYCVSFRNSAVNRSYVAEYTQSVSDTWETEEITLTLDTTGTWLYGDGETGLRVQFAFQCGSSYHTTAGSWQAGNYTATSSQVNALSSTSNYCRLANVQLEVGSAATEFERRPYTEEVTLCERYYEKSYNPSTYPATPSVEGMGHIFLTGMNTSAHAAGSWVQFRTIKAGTPTITIHSPANGNTTYAYDYGGGLNVSGVISSPGPTGWRFSTSISSSSTISVGWQWTALAELT